MSNYSTATVEGFVTHNPVTRKTKTGKSVCNFSIAVNHFSKTDSDPKVSFIDVEAWEKVAELCSSNVAKGKRIMVMGPIRQDRWEDGEGKTRSRLKIVGNQVRFIEKPVKPKEA